jgi:hypothetical protein
LVLLGGLGFYLLENDNAIKILKEQDAILRDLYQADNVTYTTVLGHPFMPQCETESTCRSDWKDNRSALFAFTVASTIGYGNHAPLTFYGRWFLILYALVSIPIAGFCFVAICARLMVFWSNIISVLISAFLLKDCDKIIAKYDRDGSGSLNEEELGSVLQRIGLPCEKMQSGDLDLEALVKEWDIDGDGELSVEELKRRILSFEKVMAVAYLSYYKLTIATLAFIVWLIFGGICFHTLEEWSYSTSFYFCGIFPNDTSSYFQSDISISSTLSFINAYAVITLTTVGFGDFVPTSAGSRFFLMIWASGGLSVIAILLGSMGEFFQVYVKSAALSRCRRIQKIMSKRHLRHTSSKLSSNIVKRASQQE